MKVLVTEDKKRIVLFVASDCSGVRRFASCKNLGPSADAVEQTRVLRLTLCIAQVAAFFEGLLVAILGSTGVSGALPVTRELR